MLEEFEELNGRNIAVENSDKILKSMIPHNPKVDNVFAISAVEFWAKAVNNNMLKETIAQAKTMGADFVEQMIKVISQQSGRKDIEAVISNMLGAVGERLTGNYLSDKGGNVKYEVKILEGKKLVGAYDIECQVPKEGMMVDYLTIDGKTAQKTLNEGIHRFEVKTVSVLGRDDEGTGISGYKTDMINREDYDFGGIPKSTIHLDMAEKVVKQMGIMKERTNEGCFHVTVMGGTKVDKELIKMITEMGGDIIVVSEARDGKTGLKRPLNINEITDELSGRIFKTYESMKKIIDNFKQLHPAFNMNEFNNPKYIELLKSKVNK